ncbi:unnamed protein product [Acanthosepion pharaonis]|uniref:C2H2-type domain-containing protein n=1 Tax=Acanthosepion pharaonis TaxID=158019 RepID=A0A812BPQ3_ACAPH|nr:unnamed protein product [Sepia pharaonis]
MRNHGDKKSFSCSLCGKVFAHKSLLKCHEKAHNVAAATAVGGNVTPGGISDVSNREIVPQNGPDLGAGGSSGLSLTQKDTYSYPNSGVAPPHPSHHLLHNHDGGITSSSSSSSSSHQTHPHQHTHNQSNGHPHSHQNTFTPPGTPDPYNSRIHLPPPPAEHVEIQTEPHISSNGSVFV